MAKINLGRVLIGGIVAGLICFVGDGLVHGVILADRWAAVMLANGKPAGDFGRQYPGVFLTYDLLKGLVAVSIYASIRPRFGPGPTTALLAAILVWILVIPVPLWGLMPMHLLSKHLAVLWTAYGLLPILFGTLAGAWLYREADVASGG